jgi:hypothetical protein
MRAAIFKTMTLELFYTEATKALNFFSAFVTEHGAVNILTPDHFGYRCSDSQEFVSMRSLFEFESEYVYQSIVAGRRIALIKLKKPITTAAGPLAYLELSDQKPDGSQKSGFDHVEFFPKDRSVETLQHFFEQKNILFTKTDRPHHVTYDHKLPEGLTLRIEPNALIAKIVDQEM